MISDFLTIYGGRMNIPEGHAKATPGSHKGAELGKDLLPYGLGFPLSPPRQYG